MAEEFDVLNPSQPTEGGGEIPSDQLVAIGVVSANMSAILQVAQYINSDGDFTVGAVDGNDSLVKVKGKTAAQWASDNPILATREFGIVTDSSNPIILKMGNGVTAFNSLPNLLLQGDLASGDLEQIKNDTEGFRDEAEDFKNLSSASETAAGDHRAASEAAAQSSQDWAVAPETTSLPGGKKSAEVSANIAAQVAQTSRFINRGLISGDETVSSGHLFKKRRYTGSSLVTITIPAGIFTSNDDIEAWIVYRKEGTGHIKFVAATGADDIVPPLIKASGSSPRRYTDAENNPGEAETYTTVAHIPDVTDGKLVVVVEGHCNDTTGMNASIGLSGGLTPVSKLTLVQPYVSDAGYAVFDADLDTFASADITITTTYGNNVQYIITHWFVIDGHGGAMITPVPNVIPPASTVSATLAGLAQGSRVCAVGSMRGPEMSASFSSFSSNVALIGSGFTTGSPNVSVSDSLNFRNGCYGRGSGVANAGGDFTVNANFGSAYARPGILIFAYPPKVVPGAGVVTLKLEGGRDTLNVANGEAEVFFWPDGTTVSIRTPDA